MSSELSVARTVVPAGITDPVESARAELKAALHAIEEKVNVPKRLGKAAKRAQRYAQRQPVIATAAAVGIAAAIGGAVWFIARTLSR